MRAARGSSILYPMTNTNAARINIRSAACTEGNLYEVRTEDGIAHVYDWTFEATGFDGKCYRLIANVVRGAVQGPDGMCPNYNARNEAHRLVDRIESRGSIDPTLWRVVDKEAEAREREAYYAPFGGAWEAEQMERLGYGALS